MNVADYARQLADLHLRRELITLGEDVVNDSYDHSLDSDANNIIEQAEAEPLPRRKRTGQGGLSPCAIRDGCGEHAKSLPR